MKTPLDMMMDFDLSEEQRAVRRAVRELRGEGDPAPRRDPRARGALPHRADPQARAARLHGAADPRAVRRLLQRRDDLRPDLRGDRARRLGGRVGRLGRELAGGRLDPALRQRRAEGALASSDRARRPDHVGVSHRDRRRHRPRQHGDHRDARGRRLAPERHQGLHLPRGARRTLLRGGDRSTANRSTAA